MWFLVVFHNQTWNDLIDKVRARKDNQNTMLPAHPVIVLSCQYSPMLKCRPLTNECKIDRYAETISSGLDLSKELIYSFNVYL